MGEVVVEVGKGNPVLCPDWLTDNDLVDVIEFVPILVTRGKRGREGGGGRERERAHW